MVVVTRTTEMTDGSVIIEMIAAMTGGKTGRGVAMTAEIIVETTEEMIAGITATVPTATMAVTALTEEMMATAIMATAPKSKKGFAMGWIEDRKIFVTADALIPTTPVTFRKAALLTAKDSAEDMLKAIANMATMADGN